VLLLLEMLRLTLQRQRVHLPLLQVRLERLFKLQLRMPLLVKRLRLRQPLLNRLLLRLVEMYSRRLRHLERLLKMRVVMRMQ
jgi:hypothetical protein